jgi:hypothetical protein
VSEVDKAGSVIAEQSVFCGDPEVSGWVLGELDYGLIVESVVLSVKAGGEGLRVQSAGQERAGQERSERTHQQGSDAENPYPQGGICPDRPQHHFSSIAPGSPTWD